MESTVRKPVGMAAFIVIWLGQIVSVLASSMSQFALSIWMYQQTESATAMGLMQVFFITPFLLMSPIAGVMVDRYNRKLMMMVSDLAAGLVSIAIFILYSAGQLAIWHLYISAVVTGIFGSFIGGLLMPAAGLLGGPLADYVMEPAMRPGGALAGLLGPLIGTGPGMSAIQLIIGVAL